MPNPKKYKSKDAFMKACIPMVLEEGAAKNNDQAIAICSNMWEKRNEEEKTKGSFKEGLNLFRELLKIRNF